MQGLRNKTKTEGRDGNATTLYSVDLLTQNAPVDTPVCRCSSQPELFTLAWRAENSAEDLPRFLLTLIFFFFFLLYFRQALERFKLLTTANRSSPAGPIVLLVPRQMVDYKSTEYGEMC